MQSTIRTDDASYKIITIPNLLSLFRLCLIPVILWLYLGKQQNILAGCVLILSGITDIADGLIARRFHMVSDLGKVLDPIADKLTQVSMLLCLLVRFPLMLFPLLLMACKELFMAVSGALIIRETGFVPGAVWHGKTATVCLYAVALLHIFWSEIPPVYSTVTIAVCLLMITLSFVLYAIRNIKLLRCRGEHKEMT